MKNPKTLNYIEKIGFPAFAAGFLPSGKAALSLALPLFLAVGPMAQAQLSLGGYAPVSVEKAIEESVEESVEETVEETVVDRVDDIIEEQTLTLGGYVAIKVEEQVEETIEETVEETVTETVEETVEEAVVETIENGIEENLEGDIEEIIEDSVEETIASAVEESVEEEVASAVEDNVEESLAAAVEGSVEETVEENVVAAVEAGVEENVVQILELSVAANIEQNVDAQVSDVIEERLESTIDNILESVESELEIDEGRIHKDQWLVMAEPEVFEKLASEGYLFDKVTELPGIGMRLAEVAAPSSFDITEVRQGVMDVLGSEHAEVDLNHIYTAGAPNTTTTDEGISPRSAISFPSDTDELALRIGMIDSQVDLSHPSLNTSDIKSRSFAPAGAEQPNFHGTAIASIITGNGGDYLGIAPKSELYAASVFENDEERGEIASTVSLVMALDWLMSSEVDVINISLAGPPNRLLQAALSRAAEQNVVILAAAGNGGPVAQPMYPAAYESVVAVTAVDSDGQVFRLANRGEYLDIAAPGVSLLHARASWKSCTEMPKISAPPGGMKYTVMGCFARAAPDYQRYTYRIPLMTWS
jgi:subtilisin family serine protease